MPLYLVYQMPAIDAPLTMSFPVAAVLTEADDEHDAAEAAVSNGGFIPGVIKAISVDLGKEFDMTLAADLTEK